MAGVLRGGVGGRKRAGFKFFVGEFCFVKAIASLLLLISEYQEIILLVSAKS